jgi:hypothetical protein
LVAKTVKHSLHITGIIIYSFITTNSVDLHVISCVEHLHVQDLYFNICSCVNRNQSVHVTSIIHKKDDDGNITTIVVFDTLGTN